MAVPASALSASALSETVLSETALPANLVNARPDAPRCDAPATATAAPLALDQAQSLLRALADPQRLRVVEALAAGERCVCDLTSELGLAQSRLSFHLKVMKEAGLISARPQGRWVYYRLQPAALELLRNWLAHLTAGCGAPARSCP